MNHQNFNKILLAHFSIIVVFYILFQYYMGEMFV